MDCKDAIAAERAACGRKYALLIDALDEDDDVQTVWGNYEVSDEIMEKLG